MKFLRALFLLLNPPRRRIVVWRHDPLPEEEIAAALAQWDTGSLQRRAVLQLIQQQLDEAEGAIGNPALAAEQLRHGAGAIDALQALQSRLDEYLP